MHPNLIQSCLLGFVSHVEAHSILQSSVVFSPERASAVTQQTWQCRISSWVCLLLLSETGWRLRMLTNAECSSWRHPSLVQSLLPYGTFLTPLSYLVTMRVAIVTFLRMQSLVQASEHSDFRQITYLKSPWQRMHFHCPCFASASSEDSELNLSQNSEWLVSKMGKS